MDPKGRIIVALDGLNREQACQAIEELAPYVGAFKVGFELIAQQQAGLVADFAAEKGANVFWDNKFHDIPQTVANASGVIAEMASVSMFDVHCLGGFEMMQAAQKAATDHSSGKRSPKVLGVTILTSHDYDSLVKLGLLPPLDTSEGVLYEAHHIDFEARTIDVLDREKCMEETIRGLVLNLALLAKSSGLDGVVASPKEIEIIRKECGPDFLIVTPGVRPVGAAVNDQKRVMTPAEAVRLGANYLVVGRPIMKPEKGSRVEAAKLIAEEIYLADMKSSIPDGQASPL